MFSDIIKKIELQSILVLLITLLFGSILLKISNDMTSPAGILGTASICVGLLYTFCSFFSNQIRENYKDVIAEYKNTISTLRNSHKDIEKSYQTSLTTQTNNGIAIGNSYKTMNSGDSRTKDS